MILALLVAFAVPGLALPDQHGLVARIGSPVFRHPNPHAPREFWLATSPDGRRLYTGLFRGIRESLSRVYVWDADTGRILNSYDPRGGSDRISGFRFAIDGLRILVDVRDNTIPPGGKHRCRLLDPLDRQAERVIHVWDDYQFRLLNPDTGLLRREGRPWPALPSESESGIDQWPADNCIVSRGEKETVLAEPETGKTTSLTPAVGGASWIHAVAPDGRAVLGMTEEGTVRLHDLPGGKVCAEWDAGETFGYWYTPDGKSLAVWVQGKGGWTLELWSVPHLLKRIVLADQKESGWIDFAPDGRTFSRELPRKEGRPCVCEIRDTATGQLLGAMPDGNPLFSPDGKIAWTTFGMRVMVPWDVKAGRIREGGPNPPGPVTAFRFTGEGQLVGLSGGHVITWDVATGKELSRVPERGGSHWWSRGIFDPAGGRLLYPGKEIVWWDFRKGAEKRVTPDPKVSPEDTFWDCTPDGRLFMSWGSGTFSVRDTTDGKMIYDRPHPGRIRPGGEPGGPTPTFASSPDGKRLAIHQPSEWQDTFALLDLTNRKADPVYIDHDHDSRVIAFSPDGRFLAAVGRSYGERARETPGMLTIWGAATGRKLKSIPIPAAEAHGMSYSPDERMVAIAFDGRVVLVDVEVRKVVASFRTCAPIDAWRWNRFGQQTPAWSPSGRLLAVETPDEGLAILDVTKLTAK